MRTLLIVNSNSQFLPSALFSTDPFNEVARHHKRMPVSEESLICSIYRMASAHKQVPSSHLAAKTFVRSMKQISPLFPLSQISSFSTVSLDSSPLWSSLVSGEVAESEVRLPKGPTAGETEMD